VLLFYFFTVKVNKMNEEKILSKRTGKEVTLRTEVITLKETRLGYDVKVKRLHIPELDMVKVTIKVPCDCVHGIAKCHPSDTFDMNRGTEIAYRRALEKLLDFPRKMTEPMFAY